MTRVCRVVPDVTAVERAFDYLVPDALADAVRVGTIVRVPLHGRRVRGWVVADAVEADTAPERLLPVAAVVSEGPPAPVVALCEWAARRWCGPVVALLRAASPANRVAPGSVGTGGAAPAAPLVSEASTDLERAADECAAAAAHGRVVVRWPPLHDRRRLVARLIASSGSSLVVTADGARAASLVAWLRRRGTPAVLLHSDAPAAARTDGWRAAARGGCVVVGGRVAAFAPFPDLRAVVVVDDADEALQEERVPTWHARDVLAERAVRAGAAFTVLSAAPTLAALESAGPPVVLPRSLERTGWPRAVVVDRREEPPGAGLLTAGLADALHGAVDAGLLAVCVLNRRGRARLLACDTCRALARWDRQEERPKVCVQCGGIRMRVLRAGVTRVREELAALLPRAEVGEVDAASDEVPDVPVLVGTEAVLHRADVRRRRPGLVAYLDLDAELLAPRYRAVEQALWLVARGAHLLAGRPRTETRLLLQTRQPDHEVVRAVLAGDPDLVAGPERERRAAVGFPPFGALAEVRGAQAEVVDAVHAARALDGQAAGVMVLGPAFEGEIASALVRAPDPDTLADALAPVRGRGVRIAVDPPRA